jgi:uncharacterized protein (TIGR00369 family)
MNTDTVLIQQFLRGGEQPLALTASSLQQLLKGEILQIDPKAGRATLAFEPGPEFLQGGGVVQGGIVTTMLDYAMAFAALAKIPADTTVGSATLTVNFMKPALPGRFIARGTVIRMGSRMLFAEAQIGPDETQLIATATTVMALIPMKQ